MALGTKSFYTGLLKERWQAEMITLGIDTSGACASVALVEDARPVCSCLSGETASHSEALGPMVEHCLRASGKDLAAIEAVGIVIGPGSFTGLRIGISFTMGLCARHGTPVVTLSSLEAMALACGVRCGKVRPLLDARRNEVFTALFAVSKEGIFREEEDQIVHHADLAGFEPAWTMTRGTVAGIEADMDLGYCATGISAALIAQRTDRPRQAAQTMRPSYLRLSAAEEKQKAGRL